jgi:hypothetical protein
VVVAVGVAWTAISDEPPGSRRLPAAGPSAAPSSSPLPAPGDRAGSPVPTEAVATARPAPTTSRAGQPAPPVEPTGGAAAPRPPVPEAPKPGPTAAYQLMNSWDEGFVVEIVLRNPTKETVSVQVRIAYPPELNVGVVNSWNATFRNGDGTLIFSGGPLDPAAEVRMGFQATKARPAKPTPTSCIVNEAPCRFVTAA